MGLRLVCLGSAWTLKTSHRSPESGRGPQGHRCHQLVSVYRAFVTVTDPRRVPGRSGALTDLTFQVIKAQDNIGALTVPPSAPHGPDGGPKSQNLHLQLGRLETPEVNTALSRELPPGLTADLRHLWGADRDPFRPMQPFLQVQPR